MGGKPCSQIRDGANIDTFNSLFGSTSLETLPQNQNWCEYKSKRTHTEANRGVLVQLERS